MNMKIFSVLFLLFFNTLPAQEYIISKESLLQKVKVLASEEFDGRLPGSEGYTKAAEYAADHFDKLGIKPLFYSYFQYLPGEYNNIITPASFRLVGENTKEYKLGEDYIFRGFTGSGSFTAPVVFCGYGISDSLYDDYANVEVTGKVVMVFKSHPAWSIEGHTFSNSYPREKAKIAADHGAIGILFVSLPNDANPQPLISSVMHGSGVQDEDFPQLHISIRAADDILAPSGIKLKHLQSKIDSLHSPYSTASGSSVHITATAEYSYEKLFENVIAIIEGSDVTLKSDYLIIGAHLDHVGSQAGEVLFPGANDNASGSAGVLEIAESFVKNNIRPKRTVIFVLFAGEEQGLIGSKYFVENTSIEPELITAMFNLDCIGFGDSIHIGNGKSAPLLWQLINNIDKKTNSLMIESTWAGGGADAQPFHDAGIPSAYFVTKNSYKHLHLPTDKVETLNGDLFEQVVRLAYLSAVDIANGSYQKEDIIKK